MSTRRRVSSRPRSSTGVAGLGDPGRTAGRSPRTRSREAWQVAEPARGRYLLRARARARGPARARARTGGPRGSGPRRASSRGSSSSRSTRSARLRAARRNATRVRRERGRRARRRSRPRGRRVAAPGALAHDRAPRTADRARARGAPARGAARPARRGAGRMPTPAALARVRARRAGCGIARPARRSLRDLGLVRGPRMPASSASRSRAGRARRCSTRSARSRPTARRRSLTQLARIVGRPSLRHHLRPRPGRGRSSARAARAPPRDHGRRGRPGLVRRCARGSFDEGVAALVRAGVEVASSAETMISRAALAPLVASGVAGVA